MGEIIRMRPKPRQPNVADQSAPAQILFFTGVRYQKFGETAEMAVWSDPRDDAGPGTNGSKRRRRA